MYALYVNVERKSLVVYCRHGDVARDRRAAPRSSSKGDMRNKGSSVDVDVKTGRIRMRPFTYFNHTILKPNKDASGSRRLICYAQQNEAVTKSRYLQLLEYNTNKSFPLILADFLKCDNGFTVKGDNAAIPSKKTSPSVSWDSPSLSHTTYSLL